MSLVTLKTLMNQAVAESFAVPEFNIDSIEFAQAVLRAAEAERAPIIIGVGQGAIEDGKMEPLAEVVKRYASQTDLPIVLHLDHSRSFPQIMQCLKLGYTSIMIDGSPLPLSENIAITQKVVEVCRALDISVEAELGTIGGVEDNIVVDKDKANLVDINDVRTFLSEVEVDALAIAIGSAHGMYTEDPKLDFDLIDEINQLTETPLVLHGGSGIPDADVNKAISLGINKVNFGTELRVEFIKGLKEAIEKDEFIYSIFESGRKNVEALVRNKINLCGANGKA